MLRTRGAGVPVRDAAITPKLSARVGVTEKGALPPACGLPRDIFETEKTSDRAGCVFLAQLRRQAVTAAI